MVAIVVKESGRAHCKDICEKHVDTICLVPWTMKVRVFALRARFTSS